MSYFRLPTSILTSPQISGPRYQDNIWEIAPQPALYHDVINQIIKDIDLRNFGVEVRKKIQKNSYEEPAHSDPKRFTSPINNNNVADSSSCLSSPSSSNESASALSYIEVSNMININWQLNSSDLTDLTTHQVFPAHFLTGFTSAGPLYTLFRHPERRPSNSFLAPDRYYDKAPATLHSVLPG